MMKADGVCVQCWGEAPSSPGTRARALRSLSRTRQTPAGGPSWLVGRAMVEGVGSHSSGPGIQYNLQLLSQGKLMRKQRWCYFHSKWNLLELTIILASWSALAMFVKRAVLAERDIQHYRNHGKE